MKKIKSFKGKFKEVTVKYEFKDDVKSIKYKHFSAENPGTPLEEEIETKTDSVDERDKSILGQSNAEKKNTKVSELIRKSEKLGTE